ncbi:hypothetical protein [Streptomyces sp. NPDC002215]|uniref:hypothetical protein n=1 Tax=Streptomyces sp. NPDC002215 TaxID=3154412 RepID=UPI0033213E4D
MYLDAPVGVQQHSAPRVRSPRDDCISFVEVAAEHDYLVDEFRAHIGAGPAVQKHFGGHGLVGCWQVGAGNHGGVLFSSGLAGRRAVSGSRSWGQERENWIEVNAQYWLGLSFLAQYLL